MVKPIAQLRKEFKNTTLKRLQQRTQMEIRNKIIEKSLEFIDKPIDNIYTFTRIELYENKALEEYFKSIL